MLFVYISDGVVNVHDLTVFAPITSLEKARGATMFVLDLQVNYLMFEMLTTHNSSYCMLLQRNHALFDNI